MQVQGAEMTQISPAGAVVGAAEPKPEDLRE